MYLRNKIWKMHIKCSFQINIQVSKWNSLSVNTVLYGVGTLIIKVPQGWLIQTVVFVGPGGGRLRAKLPWAILSHLNSHSLPPLSWPNGVITWNLLGCFNRPITSTNWKTNTAIRQHLLTLFATTQLLGISTNILENCLDLCFSFVL